MANEGKLIYKSGSGADAGKLCYKAGGADAGKLAYKAAPVGDISLEIAFSPLTWVCYTYDAQHDGILVVMTLWDGETYTIASSPFTIAIPASYCKGGTTSLQLTIATSDVCTAHEDPGVKVAFAATQNGKTTVSSFVASPLGQNGVSKTITISLSNGLVSAITE